MEYTTDMINKLIANRNISNSVLEKALKRIKIKREIIAIEKKIKSLEEELKETENAKRYVFKKETNYHSEPRDVKRDYLNNIFEENEINFLIGSTIDIDNSTNEQFSFNDAA